MSPGATTVIAPSGGGAADWFLAQSDSTWQQVAGGAGQILNRNGVMANPTLSSQLGPTLGGSIYSICDTWTGGYVIQTTRSFGVLANGGHADYPGNEGYEIDLSQNTASLAWRRIIDASAAAAIAASPFAPTTYDGTYSDGYPRAMHSGNEVYGDGLIWYPEMCAVSSDDGGQVNMILSMDRASLGAALTPRAYNASSLGPWTFQGVTNTNTFTFGFGYGLWDRINHKIYCVANGSSSAGSNFWRIDSIGATIGQSTGFVSGSFNVIPAWAVIAWDLQIIVVGDQNEAKIAVLDINPSSGTYLQWSAPASSGAITYGLTLGPHAPNGYGACYIPANHTIAVGQPADINGDIYKLQIPVSGGAYNPSGTFVGTHLTPGGGPVAPGCFSRPPPAANNYIMSKWNCIEDMGNGQSAILCYTSIDQGIFVYKVPAAGL